MMTATDTEMDFLRAIIANPDDDAIRCAFADYLLETRPDEPLVAQCIAAQCQRDAFGKRLLSVSELGNGQKWTWDCGLLERVFCAEAWWLEYGPEVMRYHPIQYVTLTDKSPDMLWSRLWSRWPLDNQYVFEWYCVTPYMAQGSTRLQLTIHQFLDGYADASANLRRKSYNSEQAALDALSRACMRWALAATEDAGRTHGQFMEGHPHGTTP